MCNHHYLRNATTTHMHPRQTDAKQRESGGRGAGEEERCIQASKKVGWEKLAHIPCNLWQMESPLCARFVWCCRLSVLPQHTHTHTHTPRKHVVCRWFKWSYLLLYFLIFNGRLIECAVRYIWCLEDIKCEWKICIFCYCSISWFRMDDWLSVR